MHVKKALLTTVAGLVLGASSLALQAEDNFPVYDSLKKPQSFIDLTEVDNTTATSEYIDSGASVATKDIRVKSMIETAKTMGMQLAVKYRYDLVNVVLDGLSLKLDKIYNFGSLMLHEGLMVPPVLFVVDGSRTLSNNNLMNTSDVTYLIDKPARLSYGHPSWRDYLYKTFLANETVHYALLPKNEEEKIAWAKGVTEGWNAGIKHAEYIYSRNMNRLTRDYTGMIRFHKLSRQKIVSIPMLAKGDISININGRKMDIGQRIFRITSKATFKDSGWTPYGAVK